MPSPRPASAQRLNSSRNLSLRSGSRGIRVLKQPFVTKESFVILSEAKNLSVPVDPREILRFAQNDSLLSFLAASLALMQPDQPLPRSFGNPQAEACATYFSIFA